MNFVGYGIAMLGVGIGLGLIGNGAMHGMSRQPEAISKLQTVMLRMLRESELVSNDGIISAPSVSGRCIQVLQGNSPSHLLFFPIVIENGRVT